MVEAAQEVQLKSMLDQGGALLGTPDCKFFIMWALLIELN